jgi:hypothetical protein
LGADGHTAYTAAANYTSETWSSEYEAQIGEPTSAATAIAGGAWKRTFTNGLVVVNPTGASASVNLGGTYSGSGLTDATSATMAPHTALILQGVGGGGKIGSETGSLGETGETGDSGLGGSDSAGSGTTGSDSMGSGAGSGSPGSVWTGSGSTGAGSTDSGSVGSGSTSIDSAGSGSPGIGSTGSGATGSNPGTHPSDAHRHSTRTATRARAARVRTMRCRSLRHARAARTAARKCRPSRRARNDGR